jgi:hypothetical protein
VLERVADGGAVLFVDHDQARLAGRVSERWVLDRGRVSVFPADAVDQKADNPVVVVELAGLGVGSVARVEVLPGVLSCQALGARLAGGGTGRVAVRVAAARSDDVLRQVLAWDRVHVVAVSPATGSRDEACG